MAHQGPLTASSELNREEALQNGQTPGTLLYGLTHQRKQLKHAQTHENIFTPEKWRADKINNYINTVGVPSLDGVGTVTRNRSYTK